MASVYTQASIVDYYDGVNSVDLKILTFQASYFTINPYLYFYVIGSPQNPSASPYAVFTADADAITYYTTDATTQIINAVNAAAGVTTPFTALDVETVTAPEFAFMANLSLDTIAQGSTNKYYTATEKAKLASLAVQVNADWGSGSGLAQIFNKPTVVSAFTNDAGYLTNTALSGYATSAAVASTYATQATVSGKFNTPTGSTSQYVRGDGSLATLPVAASRSFANPSRTLNSSYQISATRDAMVSYAVNIAAALSLSGGQTGTVTLQYADDSGFTTNVVSVNSATNGNTGTLTIGLGLTQTGTAGVSGIIPAGKYVKLVTANTAGTPTFSYLSGQEVLL